MCKIAVGPERTESHHIILAHFLTRLLWVPILAAAFAYLAEATHVIGTFLTYLYIDWGLTAVEVGVLIDTSVFAVADASILPTFAHWDLLWNIHMEEFALVTLLACIFEPIDTNFLFLL